MLNQLQVVRALTAATLCLMSFGVAATSWETAVALPMRVEHDTNPNLDSQDSKAVTRTILTPDYRLTVCFWYACRALIRPVCPP